MIDCVPPPLPTSRPPTAVTASSERKQAIIAKQPQRTKKPNTTNNSGRKPAVTSRTLSCSGVGRQAAPLEKPKRQFEISRADNSSEVHQKSNCSATKSLVKRQQSTPSDSELPQSFSALLHQKSFIPQPLPRNSVGCSPRRTSTVKLALSNTGTSVNQPVNRPSVKESTQTNELAEHLKEAKSEFAERLNLTKTVHNGNYFLEARENKGDPCEEDIREFESCLRSAIHDYCYSSDSVVDELVSGKPQLTSTPLSAKLEKGNVENTDLGVDKSEQKFLQAPSPLLTNLSDSLEDVKIKLLFELDVIEKQQQHQSSFVDIIIAPPSPDAFVTGDQQQLNDNKQENLTTKKVLADHLIFIQPEAEFTSRQLHKALSHPELIEEEEKLLEEKRKDTINNDLQKVNEKTFCCSTKESHTIFGEKTFVDEQEKTSATEDSDDSGIDDHNNSSNNSDFIVSQSVAGALTVSENPSVSKIFGDEGEVQESISLTLSSKAIVGKAVANIRCAEEETIKICVSEVEKTIEAKPAPRNCSIFKRTLQFIKRKGCSVGGQDDRSTAHCSGLFWFTSRKRQGFNLSKPSKECQSLESNSRFFVSPEVTQKTKDSTSNEFQTTGQTDSPKSGHEKKPFGRLTKALRSLAASRKASYRLGGEQQKRRKNNRRSASGVGRKASGSSRSGWLARRKRSSTNGTHPTANSAGPRPRAAKQHQQ